MDCRTKVSCHKEIVPWDPLFVPTLPAALSVGCRHGTADALAIIF